MSKEVTIHLRDKFEDSLVARSQAKQLYDELDDCTMAQLDFSGFKWVGPSFMHQIFVVYQNEHPSVELKAINMCPDVAAMYNHAMAYKEVSK